MCCHAFLSDLILQSQIILGHFESVLVSTWHICVLHFSQSLQERHMVIYHVWIQNMSVPLLCLASCNHGKKSCLCVAVESWACFILMATSVVFAVVCYTYYPPFGWFWLELVELVSLPCCSEQVLGKGSCLSAEIFYTHPKCTLFFHQYLMLSFSLFCLPTSPFFPGYSAVQYVPKLCQELIC